MKVLGIVPARGGSKGVPRKNIRPLAGKPLIAYTIEEARKSKHIDRLVVSTEDQEIAGIARSLGAEVVIRPVELASDTASTELALLHVLESLQQREGYEPDVVVTLEPTSPLRSYQLIDRCIRQLVDTGADSVVTVAENRDCFGKLEDGRFVHLFPGQPRRRQDREPLYKECSAVYATKTHVLLERRSVLGERVYAVVAPEEEVIDINTPLDFALAEAVMLNKMRGAPQPETADRRAISGER